MYESKGERPDAVSDEFVRLLDELIERIFKDAPAPDGTTETNRRHQALKDAVIAEMAVHVAALDLQEPAARTCRAYVEGKAASAVYALFTTTTKVPRNPRLKGTWGRH